MARPRPGTIYAALAVDVPGPGRIFNPPLRGGWETVRSADCHAHGQQAVRASTANRSIEPRRESDAGSGRLIAAPTRRPGAGL